jgi:exodeoxyribonuclease VII small subunit
MSAKPKATATEPTFETAMDRLEAIVEQMESGKLPLEELIVRYEEGMSMVKVCQERLTAAEHKIEIIARDNAGQAVVKPFEPESVANAPEPERQKNDNNDDVSLF